MYVHLYSTQYTFDRLYYDLKESCPVSSHAYLKEMMYHKPFDLVALLVMGQCNVAKRILLNYSVGCLSQNKCPFIVQF